MDGHNRASETNLVTEWVVVTRKSLLWKIFDRPQMFLISLLSAHTAEPDFILLKIKSRS
jgi:hypothetical protein